MSISFYDCLNICFPCWAFLLLLWKTIEYILKHVCVFCPYYKNQWGPKMFEHFSIVFYIKKVILVWNDMRERKLWKIFNFWVNYPFKFDLVLCSHQCCEGLCWNFDTITIFLSAVCSYSAVMLINRNRLWMSNMVTSPCLMSQH